MDRGWRSAPEDQVGARSFAEGFLRGMPWLRCFGWEGGKDLR